MGGKSSATDGASLPKPKVARKPKQKCCNDRPRCKRCPLRMLKEGTLPAGYAVRKRRLVKQP